MSILAWIVFSIWLTYLFALAAVVFICAAEMFLRMPGEPAFARWRRKR